MNSDASKTGSLGEQLVSEALSRLPPHYRQFDNVIIPVRGGKGGTTQIDHILASPFGIFVIETKMLKGAIQGLESDRYWFQIVGSKRFTFRNPLSQNRFHAVVLADHLGLSDVSVKPVVVFVGLAQLLSSHRPKNLISTIAVGAPDLRRYIEGFTCQIFNEGHLSTVLKILTKIKDNGLTMEHHVASIHCRDLQRRVNAVLRLNGAPHL